MGTMQNSNILTLVLCIMNPKFPDFKGTHALLYPVFTIQYILSSSFDTLRK